MSSAPAPAPAGDAPPAKKGGMMMIIIIVVVLLVAGGGGAAYFMMSKKKAEDAADSDDKNAKSSKDEKGEKGEKKKKKGKKQSDNPVFINLEPFTVNLRDEDTERYLQASVVLQVAEEKEGDTIKGRMPQVRDRILALMSNKKSEQLLGSDGKKKLADEIIEELKKPFGSTDGPEIEEVFFTSFIIQ